MSDQEYYMPWGKHAKENIDDVPRSYLDWLMEQDWMENAKNQELYEEIEQQLAMRDRSHITT